MEIIKDNPSLAEQKDQDGVTLLMHCASRGGSADVLRALVDAGADPNAIAFDGSTALSRVIVSGSQHGLTTLPELSALLDLGCDPSRPVECGMPALHWAISQNRLEHARLLLEWGCSTEARTFDDPPETSREIAARLYNEKALALLDMFRKRNNMPGPD